MEMVKPAEAAKMLHCNKYTLARWRQAHYGPVPFRVGCRVFYDADDIENFLRAEFESARQEWNQS
jgi:hypothetical protein